MNKPKSIKHIDDFISLVNNEISFWQTLSSKNSNVNEILNHFRNNIQNKINQALSFANSGNLSNATNHIREAINHAKINRWPVIYSFSPIAKVIEKNIDEGAVEPIVEYLRANQIKGERSDYWYSLIEFVLSTRSGTKNLIKKSVEAEQEALAEIRDQYLKEFETIRDDHAQVKQDVAQEFKQFKDSLGEWESETTTQVSTFLGESGKTFTDSLKNFNQEFTDLKDRYEKHISLKAPAEYWKQFKRSYFIQGMVWMVLTTISTGLFIWFLYKALSDVSSWVVPVTEEDKTAWIQNFKGALIFALMVSAGAFLLRLFVRLSISAFHLSRDAAERLQLTTVYLSLLKETGAVNESERSIVLQSIFSRADTGLLKGDSAPTMPNAMDVVTQLSRSNGK